LFIPCIIGNRFMILNQQNAQTCSLDIYINMKDKETFTMQHRHVTWQDTI